MLLPVETRAGIARATTLQRRESSKIARLEDVSIKDKLKR
jgi:hypothetical protein